MQKTVTYLILLGFLLFITKPFKPGEVIVKDQSTSLFKYKSVQKNNSSTGDKDDLVLEEDINEEGEESAVKNHSKTQIDCCVFQLKTFFALYPTSLAYSFLYECRKLVLTIYSLRVLRI